MVKLSVNLNKFALIRNARGGNAPDILEVAKQCIGYGVHGITVHPRSDERHIRYSDVYQLKQLIKRYPQVEFNIEGYPTQQFLELIKAVQPHQCTLVPDKPDQLTSDHGWNISTESKVLRKSIQNIQAVTRVSLFVDADSQDLALVKQLGAKRIELYTEPYADAYQQNNAILLETQLEQYKQTADTAVSLGVGVNAGHDLSLKNLAHFLKAVPVVEEVSIGHALVIEAVNYGLAATIRQYLALLKQYSQQL